MPNVKDLLINIGFYSVEIRFVLILDGIDVEYVIPEMMIPFDM